MKVAVVYVTRSKVNLEQYNLLGETAYDTVYKYLKGIVDKETTEIRNYLINCGMTWGEMDETFDEIMSKHFDVIIFWITPGSSKLKIFYPNFCEVIWKKFENHNCIKLQHVNNAFINWNSVPTFGFKTPYIISF